jgi:hypothetical protein
MRDTINEAGETHYSREEVNVALFSDEAFIDETTRFLVTTSRLIDVPLT